MVVSRTVMMYLSIMLPLVFRLLKQVQGIASKRWTLEIYNILILGGTKRVELAHVIISGKSPHLATLVTTRLLTEDTINARIKWDRLCIGAKNKFNRRLKADN